MSERFDVAVIGGGPAGYVAAIRASQLGGRVVLFEKDALGGTCLNRGCIPTKTYLRTAETLREMRHAGERGISLGEAPVLRMPEALAYKNTVVQKLTGGVEVLLRSNGVTVVRGEASLLSPTEIRCGEERYTAAATILCGGSVAGRIPVPGIDLPGVVTSDGILDADRIPERLAVIGGGVIGCEIATAFAAFGSEVTVIEALPKLVAPFDAEISLAVKKSLAASGVSILLGAKLERIESGAQGLQLFCEGAEPISADLALLSVGRKADLGCLGALADTVATERGKILVDAAMRTNLPNLYAAGDLVAGAPMLAHAAFRMGEVAAANAMGSSEIADLSLTPSCLYTLPEAAGVGLTEEQAKEKYSEALAVGRFRFGANGRALACGEPDGFVKVLLDKASGLLVGVHIFGAMATEMISEPAALMTAHVPAAQIAETIHPHPTYSEAFLEAVTDALGRCIHAPVKKKLR